MLNKLTGGRPAWFLLSEKSPQEKQRKRREKERKKLRKSKWFFLQQEAKRTKSYKEFLQSRYWKRIRIIILKRDDFKCFACGNRKCLQVHHTKYGEVHYNEHKNLDTLRTLCDKCHKKVHKIVKTKPI